MDEQNAPKQRPRSFLPAALLSYLLGYLWICCFLLGFSDERYENFPTDRIALWFPLLFTAAYFLWGNYTVRSKPVKSKEHLFWLVCTLLIAVAMATGRCRAVEGWCYLALHGFAAYWAICRTDMLTDGKTSEFLPFDLLNTFIIQPFGNFFLRIVTLFYCLRGAVSRLTHRDADSPHRFKNGLITLLVVLIALPVFLLAGNLLGQADEAFARLWQSIGSFFTFTWQRPRWIGEFLLRFLFGLPVGAYLFGLVGGCYRREARILDTQTGHIILEQMRFAPMKVLSAVMAAFIGLYLLFFGVQASHLLGAFFSIVPGKLTASQYARQGFFQLCEVMAINFALLGAAAVCGKAPLRKHRILRIFGTVLMVESIFLAITAAGKLALYIHRFGFTALRLLSMWGILVLTAGCLLSIASLYKPCGAARKWVLFAAATFTLLCFY